MVNSRQKGHRAERHYRTIFIEVGFENCKSSREASKLHDDLGIDLCHLPFLVQIKSGYPKTNMITQLELYIERVIAYRHLIPNEYTKPFVLIHHKNVKPGHRRKSENSIVFMRVEDYNEFCKLTSSFVTNSDNLDFRIISDKHVTMYFDTFLNFIKCLAITNSTL